MIHGWPTRLAGLVLASLVAACQATAPPGEEPAQAADGLAAATALDQQKGRASAMPTPIDWSHGDCLSQLRTLQQVARDGRLGPNDRPPFVVDLVAPTGSWLDGVPDIPIEVDLPLAVVATGPPDGARCVLRIGPAHGQTAAHRAVDLQDVHSAYQSSLRSERNPEYDAAQLSHRRAKDRAKSRQKVMRTGDPLLDLIGSAVGGAIATFDQHVRGQALDSAAADIAATPRSRDKPVYRDYSFERVVVRAQKQALVPVALLDAAGRTLQATELRQSERREFFVLRGLDPRDRDYEQHRATSMTQADLARWTRTPPALRLSSVAIALTEGPPALEEEPLEDSYDVSPVPWPGEDAPGVTPELWIEDALADKELPEPPASDLDELKSAPMPLPIAASLPAIDDPDVDDLVPGLGRGPIGQVSSGLPDAHPSVVGIRAGGVAGHGFYVREDLVVTTYALVGSVSVADVTTADGATVPALVAAIDPARDLALMHVPRPGPAAPLAEGLAPTPYPAADLGAGHPLFIGDRVAGMTSREGVIGIESIRVFLAGQAGVLAALP